MPVLILLIAIVFHSEALGAVPIELSLERALALAEANDTGLESARIDIETGDAIITEATAGALPTINLTASTGRFVIAPTTSIPAFGPDRIRFAPVNDAAIGILVSQPVWLGGRVGLALEAAGVYSRLARVSIEGERARLKRRVIQDYFQLHLARGMLEVIEETYTQTTRHFNHAQKMFAVGMLSEFDLLRAQTQVLIFEPEIARARQSVELAETNLINRLGLPVESELTLTDSLMNSASTAQAVTNEELFSNAVRNRPEFKLVDLQKQLTKIELQAEGRSILWPNIYFTLGYQTQAQDDHYKNMNPSTWSTSQRWGLSIAVPLFNGFATEARTEKVRLGLRKIELADRNLSDGVRLEITAAVSELNRAKSVVRGQSEALRLSEKAYQISLIRFEQGLGTELDVQDARHTLSRAKLGLLQGFYDLRMADAEFARVINSDGNMTTGVSQ